MNCKLWIRWTLTTCLMFAILSTYSMVALANPDRMAAELTITGNGVNGDVPTVTVNGEQVRSGRSVFSSSVIATPSNAGAILYLGKTGIELAPGTTFTVSFDDKSVGGDLAAGKLTVLGSSSGVSIKVLTGQIVTLATGQSVNAAGKKDDPDDDAHGGAAWWVWIVIFGGAAAIIAASFTANNKISLGGTASTVSPVR